MENKLIYDIDTEEFNSTSDVRCPFCGAFSGVEDCDYMMTAGNNDDIYDMECEDCGKTYYIHTGITVSFSVSIEK